MTCAEAESQLVAAADGRLDLTLEMRLAAHLEGCAGCRERAALWRRLVPGMRELAPAPPDAMRTRRMQIEIERQLAPASSVAPVGRWRRARWPAAGLALVGAAAVLVLWARPEARAPMGSNMATVPAPAATPPFAVVVGVEGELRAGDRPVAPSSKLGVGTELSLAGPGRVALVIGRETTVRLVGPTRVLLGGTRRDVALRLDGGTLEAEVAHRSAGETFAVVTRDLRVEVRGTRFAVGSSASGSWVRVDEGRVEARFGDGRVQLVSAGETASSLPSSSSEAPAPPPAGAPAPASCAETRRICEAAAHAARDSMRAGDRERALHLLAAVPGRERSFGGACGSGVVGCEDELGYLRAEALRGGGRIDAAISAYKALDRRGAPPAMRQNALYAAAELERRMGSAEKARADYQRALKVAPRGALRAEALVGAMESAASAGDAAGARAMARRYLAEFPAGFGARSAQRILSGGRP